MTKGIIALMLLIGLTSCEKTITNTSPTNTSPTEIRVVKNGTLDWYGSTINGASIEDSWYGATNQSRTYTLYKVGDNFTFYGGWYPIMPPSNSSYHCELKVYVNNTLVQTVRAYADQPVSYSFTKTN